MADKMKPGPATPVRSIGHDGASRTNIPTAELESFVKDEEKRPTILRYPRGPTLDPQLVWKGRDEQIGRWAFLEITHMEDAADLIRSRFLGPVVATR